MGLLQREKDAAYRAPRGGQVWYVIVLRGMEYSGRSFSSLGRAWTHRELRNKSWEDIHALWWICCKERNRLATEKAERARLKAGAGDAESKVRDMEASFFSCCENMDVMLNPRLADTTNTESY